MSLNCLNLNGTWGVRWSDGQRGRPEYANRDTVVESRYLPATVPGEIHLDLIKAGLIEEPTQGLNCLSARWVEEMIWSYRREFTAPRAALAAGARAWLVFEALDLVATIVLNGKEIGRHRNVFYPCRLDVTGALRTGKNVLTVHLDGGLYDVSDKPGDLYNGQLDHKLHKRSWLRKPQCQFGWDWSTRLINVGITGPVHMEWTADPVRVERLVPLATLTPDLATGSVRARLFVEGLGKTPVKADLTVQVAPGNHRVTVPVEIQPGPGVVEAVVPVPKPALWWPVGCGPQSLHTVTATLKVKGRALARPSATIGFRHVRVDQSPHPAGGRSFVIEINGRKVFCKGGNFVPADMIFARIDRRRYEVLTDRALESNFNMLRVWGGGLYESDDFYDCCNRKGLLVWQEFVFACSRYPGTDAAFLEDVRREARHQVRRLAAHPSLIVWCGNNEMEWGAWDWGYDRLGAALPDYALFHNVLPRILAEEDPTRYYQPSSPYSPDGLTPNRDDVGDQHPWSVGFADTDFRKYRAMTCRFPNEGGILGPTSLPTMLDCLPAGQRTPQSFAWQVHDNSVDSWGEPSYPDAMLRNWLGLDLMRLSIEDFVYWGGLLQGEGLREYIANFRRRMFDSASAIFWMYNDSWPVSNGWTIVDYYRRKKLAYHPVRRANQPVTVVVADDGATITVYGVNDTPQPWAGTLRWGLFTLAGARPVEETQAVSLPANAATPLASFPRAQWEALGLTQSGAFAVLFDGDRLYAQHRLFLARFKELAFTQPHITLRRDGDTLTLTSDAFAWGVCLDLDGELPLADNCVDLLPGIPYTMPWRDACGDPRVLRVGNALALPV